MALTFKGIDDKVYEVDHVDGLDTNIDIVSKKSNLLLCMYGGFSN